MTTVLPYPFVFAVVRGDMDLNETKLANALGAEELRPARTGEILAAGAEPGYASPVGLKDVFVVADDVLPDSPNLVAGANEEGFHLLNVNYGRDFEADVVADVAMRTDVSGGNADDIVMIGRGRIVSQGSKAELLKGAGFATAAVPAASPMANMFWWGSKLSRPKSVGNNSAAVRGRSQADSSTARRSMRFSSSRMFPGQA